ncbi:MAG TPA: hypothetical protein PL151_15180 [Phycisphaerae bacterium]|nr:hypothetical protein [Phycisphaerae bacterium]HOJ74021.1 hypothetical protein [Phycisphaerae bacterium]HOM50616.1 hypothetical protein [Phycisphaerae bacterium]HON66195.1 hypothetical protein [Phycisphaerae bacterium]HOQ87547.1 hypothetical protein [Phycisphaerae bacterium]
MAFNRRTATSPIGWPRLVLAGAALLLAGCDTVRTADFLEVQREAQAAKEQVATLETQLSAEQQTVRNLQRQLANMRGMDPDVLDQLVTPVKIKLASQSGGYDQDGKPGDDGIVLYVQPLDKEGDVIKAAGSFVVNLLNLSDASNPRVIATYEFDVPTTLDLWYGRFMTNHFTLRCPWPPSGPPDTDEVTARVEFTVLLTGRVLIAQERFEINRAAELPATKPGR